MNKRQERLHLLEKQMGRLNRRREKLDPISNRYSWICVAIFFIGLSLSLVGFLTAGLWVCLALIVVTSVAFAFFAHLRNKIDRSLARHTLWLHIKSTHVARMKLNWKQIPATSTTDPQGEHPFEIDLDITGTHSLHQLLNTAVSREGSQRLREWLLSTNPDLSTIYRRQTLVRELIPMTLFRDKLTMNSLFASRRVAEQVEGKRLLNWLDQQQVLPTTLLPLLLGASVLHILTILFVILSLFLVMPQLWVFSLLGSIFLLFTTAKRRGDIFEDAVYLQYGFAILSTIFGYLETYPYGKHQHLKKLCEPFYLDREQSPSRLLKRIARIASAATLKNNGLLWLLINALVPWDFYCAYRLSSCKAEIAARLPTWLDIWFELEALNSLATFAYLNPEYVLPDVVAGEAQTQGQDILFQAKELGHPLLPSERRVTNDFTMNKLGEVVIITGSNMAGKSTFLRSLGINLCLAYAGGPVNASALQTTLFRIFTCIRVSDSVVDGFSYFFAEVRRLRALLVELERNGGFPLFFLVDEIFKGTNNRERLIGSRSYVRALVGQNCVGAISTHDLELVKLADVLPEVQNNHFKEEVIDGQMVFDYKLRSGPCPTTNALKIMRMEGLPVDEVEQAV